MQCVCCCLAVRFEGVGVATPVHMEMEARQGSPTAGLDNEHMVCSSGRAVGLLDFAV